MTAHHRQRPASHIDSIECNGCGKTVQMPPPGRSVTHADLTGWLIVHEWSDMLRRDGSLGPLHACCWTCLARIADDQPDPIDTERSAS